MRNPFRKMSSEEEFVAGFIRGMKDLPNSNPELQLVYELIKVQFNNGDYVEAQKSINELTQAMTSAFRAEKRSNL